MAGRYLSLNRSLQFGFYLACSWLWCLGAFFPLILSRDYGWPALLAFTLFNVGGAMAMGFYFKNKRQQQIFQTQHKRAISWFSYITIAYQVFFVSWLGSLIGNSFILPLVILLAAAIYFVRRYMNINACLFYVLSMGLFMWFANFDWPPIDITPSAYWPHAIVPLAIGFIFSPYLDITFHRAFRESPHPKMSFFIGFGVLFLSLLIFVFVYAGSLFGLFFDAVAYSNMLYPVLAFLVLQLSFTIAAHLSELKIQSHYKSAQLLIGLGALSAIIFSVVTGFKNASIPWLNIPLEETIYKVFLFFYSLVFPLYLLLNRVKNAFVLVLTICTPAYAFGFLIDTEYSYALSVGVACLVSGVIVLRKQKLELSETKAS